MGIGGISVWQLIILLVIVVLVFGTKRLRTLGSDLGSAVKGFRTAMSDAEKDEPSEKISDQSKDDADFENTPAEITAAIDPILIEHRDYIMRTYYKLPLEL